MASGVVGLDIGSTAVRAVEIIQKGKTKPRLVRSYDVALPSGAVSRGEILEPEIVQAALKKLWSQGGFKSKKVILGTGNQGVIVRDLTVPKMSLKHIRESLPFHVQSLMQVPLSESLLDFYPTCEELTDQGPVVTGLLIAAEKKEILGNVNVVEGAGLIPTEVDLIPFALSRLLVNRSEISETVALIDIGATTTSIIISNKGIPYFVRIIPAGGGDLTDALCAGLEIDPGNAEGLKRTLKLESAEMEEEESTSGGIRCKCAKCVAENPTTYDPRSTEILHTVNGELLGSLRSTINYFNNTRPQEPVEQILLAGGGAQLSGMAQALSEITHVPVSFADPFAGIVLAGKKKAKRPQPNGSFAVALGLAWGSTA